MATWNVRGKSLAQIADVLSDRRIHFDAIALQEVGSLAQGKLTPNGFLQPDDQIQLHPHLSDYWVLCTDQLHSHLGQALLIGPLLRRLRFEHPEGGSVHWSTNLAHQWRQNVALFWTPPSSPSACP